MSRIDLERIRDWATAKLSSGQGPLDAGQPYMTLRESVDAILAGMNSDTPPSDRTLRHSPGRRTHLVLVWSNDSRSINR
jgi:hypothetical protein